jgi:ABC-type transporter Mla subunit MlaD
MAERRDIPDALREAVERTVQATSETRVRAQDAVDDLGGTVDELVKNAEKGLRTGRRNVRAAVGERLPASQDEMKGLRAELRKISRRLDAIEERLAEAPGSKPKAKPRSKSKSKKSKPK